MNNPEFNGSPETGEKEYKKVVEQIKNLNWEKLGPSDIQRVMYLSYIAATEFAESLRIAQTLYPNNHNLQEMVEGELQTTNLSFEDYSAKGDHADFLEHFLMKNNLVNDGDLKESGEKYLAECRRLPDHVRTMTVFSREEELPGIFERILQAPDWSADGLAAFQYYLKRHIALDSQEGGHADLTKEFPVNDSVKPFYETRLNLYRPIAKLFKANV